ncbi:hypothetical protein [Cochleicola gelatinilyticus]|nr:hypothetical protein [Cochleicola gelatinilyticus]
MAKKLTKEQLETLNRILQDYSTDFKQDKEHPTKRVDILLNAICGGGLFLIFNFLKEVDISELSSIQTNLIIISGVGFMLSILMNYFALETSLFQINTEEKLFNDVANTLKDQGDGWREKFLKKEEEATEEVHRLYYIKSRLYNTSKLTMTLSVILLGIFFVKYVLN